MLKETAWDIRERKHKEIENVHLTMEGKRSVLWHRQGQRKLWICRMKWAQIRN
jgi:hypothetical protein